jgi:hypothetical protein
VYCIVLYSTPLSPSLPSDGIGITPRELVQYIHAGNFENVLESHGVALQEMENAFFGNHSDRRVFLKTLDNVLKRLKDVEANGYSPPDLLEMANSVAESEESHPEAHHQTESDAAADAASRKRKKKKKKKQTQKETTDAGKSSTASVASVQSSLAPEKQEEEDPLVTALLGMGFTEEQISAAVKACGGTHRATADDLVMYILGGGAESEEQPADTQQPRQEEVEVNESTVVKTKVVDEEKIAEEEAKKQEEATMQLAAKREEKRRRNREWNNREQARQQQEVNIKLAQVAAVSQQQAQPTPPGYAGAFPTLQTTAPLGLQTGMPNGVHAGATAGVGAGLTTGLPAPTQVKPAPQPQRQPVQYMGLPPPLTSSVAQSVLSTASPVPPQALSNMHAGTEFPSLSRSVMLSNPVTAVSATPAIVSYNAFPPIGDDEKTVSSIGSNPGFSVSSASFVSPFSPPPAMPPAVAGIPPPGFMPPSGGPASKPPPNQSRIVPPVQESASSDYSEELNQHGEIRATAKAFVPSNFTPAVQRAQSTTLPPLSSSFAPPPGSQMSGPPKRSFNPPAAFPSGLLGAGGPPLTSSLRANLTNAYDRVPSGTPVSDDSVPVPSAGSSLTGVPSTEEQPQSLGLPLGFGTNSQPGSTSSLLNSAFTNGPPVGGASIWGGSQAVPSLGGFPPISFGDDNREKMGEPQTGGEHNSTWGAAGGSNLAGGPGSIW